MKIFSIINNTLDKNQFFIMQKLLFLLTVLLLVPITSDSQQKMIKILVSTPYIEHKEYQPIADVMAGSIIRELARAGGMEIIERGKSDKYLKEKGLDSFIETRELAFETGGVLGADIIIYSTIEKKYDNLLYSIVFLEVEKNIIQRNINGSFRVSESASEIGRIMKEQTQKLLKYVPLPSELVDPGSVFRERTIDYERLPTSVEIEDIPPMDRFGYIEQIFSYYRVFPGEVEYEKFQQQKLMTRFAFREDLNEELTDILNNFYIYGDFAIRHNLQAYLIKDCSVQAINVLLANKIPVFYIDGVLIGYKGLAPGGSCLFNTMDNRFVETFDLTHGKRLAVMFVVPKPGRKNGISKGYLERAVGYYRDEWSKTPTLVEIKDSMFDIISRTNFNT